MKLLRSHFAQEVKLNPNNIRLRYILFLALRHIGSNRNSSVLKAEVNQRYAARESQRITNDQETECDDSKCSCLIACWPPNRST
ncbi:hypothetical protein HPB48_015131 [Haemaphysalis longicornis]|uniref:Uncharacterized protein n=1 Tax=Haemaphysalis longicornis TaxID=44386 RepID=A0A9J6GJR8_HAELO|nr:hypothetical protein HPB48_015131 [Haemaphysalis longicornis]